MNRFQSVKTDNLVKLSKYPVKIIDNIISSIPDMTGIQTDAQFLFQLHLVNNLAQFLKVSSYLAALS